MLYTNKEFCSWLASRLARAWGDNESLYREIMLLYRDLMDIDDEQVRLKCYDMIASELYNLILKGRTSCVICHN